MFPELDVGSQKSIQNFLLSHFSFSKEKRNNGFSNDYKYVMDHNSKINDIKFIFNSVTRRFQLTGPVFGKDGERRYQLYSLTTRYLSLVYLV